jgi:hypothetical protein
MVHGSHAGQRYDASMAEDPIQAAHAKLHAHSTADLRFDEHLRPLKYVIAPDGRLVCPVMVAMLQTADTVLFVPAYSHDDAMLELQVTMLPFEERGEDGAQADRWRIHHGEPEDVRWAYLSIDAARFGELVIDGDALMIPNPLAGDEASLCRWINQEHADDLRALCAKFGSMKVEAPLMVGIDPLGIGVRATFDVVRIPASEPMHSARAARSILLKMIEAAVPSPE